jgi:hypothetical protein
MNSKFAEIRELSPEELETVSGGVLEDFNSAVKAVATAAIHLPETIAGLAILSQVVPQSSSGDSVGNLHLPPL